MSISQIVDGTVKNIFNQEEDLYNNRIKICRNCKLLRQDSIFGEVCNPSIYLNPITNETSYFKKEGFYNGCGCILRSKTRVKEAHCPVGKW